MTQTDTRCGAVCLNRISMVQSTGNTTAQEQHDNFETEYLLGTSGEVYVEIDAFIHYRDGRGLQTERGIKTRTLCPY
jgi:hypothetical protein